MSVSRLFRALADVFVADLEPPKAIRLQDHLSPVGPLWARRRKAKSANSTQKGTDIRFVHRADFS